MNKKLWHLHLTCIFCFLILMTEIFAADGLPTVSEKVDGIIAEVITAGMSEKDKALALHDWLTDHAYYDLTYSYYDEDGVLLYGTGVCDSYSKAYKILLDRIGIDNFRITGEAINQSGVRESHSWNVVKIDGEWTHIDVTWDDPIDPGNPNSNLQKSGNEQHLYFMVSNRVMMEDHFPDSESAALVEDLFTGQEEVLPAPVDTSARVEAPDFSLETSTGNILTKAGYGTGKKLMMIYGRTTCGNTLAFLNVIKPYICDLKENGVTVLLALFDDPQPSEIKQMETNYPGIVAAKLTADDNSMGKGLDAFQYNNDYVIFPVIFLKNAQNAFVYYSVGYVENPLCVVSGALVIPAGAAPSSQNANTSDISQQKTDSASTQKTTTAAKAVQPGNSSANVVKSVIVGNGKYKLNLSKKTAALTAPKNKNITKLVIPAVVKANNKTYKVNSISASACKGLKKLSAVTIGKNVISIGKNAFYGCSKLKTISGCVSVTTIGTGAYTGCIGLKTVPAFAKLKTIGANAFKNCKLLPKITIGSKVTKIGSNAFRKCAKLKSITIKSSKLTSKTVGANAFKGIYAKATIKVPKAKLKTYTTLLKKKGVGKKVKITK